MPEKNKLYFLEYMKQQFQQNRTSFYFLSDSSIYVFIENKKARLPWVDFSTPLEMTVIKII